MEKVEENKEHDKSSHKERILEEHKVNEPVYDEGISGYSAASMKIIYEEEGIDLTNRDKQLENV